MIEINNSKVSGFDTAIRGMRNPFNSWEKSDSVLWPEPGNQSYIGKNDLELMMKLSKAGTDHSKFMRMINVSMDINAPLYWWKEFDTYKVGTVANSCSTMHKIHEKEFTLDDFSHEHLDDESMITLCNVIDSLNASRRIFVEGCITKYFSIEPNNKDFWWQMIQLLPSSYNQKRTISTNYAVLKNIYHARKDHKLDEWRDLCNWIRGLPYSEIITNE